MSLLRTTGVLAALGLFALAAPAALAVDCTANQFVGQGVDFGPPQTHGNGGGIEVGQTFTAPCDGAAGIFTYYFTSLGGTAGQFLEIQGSIYEGTDPATWTLLHTDLRRLSPVPAPGVVANNFVLLGNVPIVEGRQYTILLDTPPANGPFQNPDIFIQWSNTDRFAGGSMFYHGAFGGFPQTGADMRFDLGFQPPTAVPVELTAFDAVTDGDEVMLAWETASETNNAGFDVEVQSAGTDWQQVAFVNGHGTTAEARRYTHRVDGLAVGTHRFRLRQVDFDGTATHTPEVEVSLALAGTHVLAVWPNPTAADGQVRLQVAREQAVAVTLYDALGRQVAVLFEGQAGAGASIEARLPAGLSAGLYVVRARGEGFAETARVTVAR